MKNWQRILFILFIVLLQVSLAPCLKYYNSIDLPMIFLIICLIRKDDLAAMWWVALGGLLMDLFSQYFFGYYCLEFLLIFLLYKNAIRPILHDPELPVIAVFIVGLNFLIFVLDAIINKLNPFSSIASVVIYQSAASIIIYMLYSRIAKRNRLLLQV